MLETVLLLLATLAALLLAVASLLPLLSTGAWVVRLCDFPRLQILVLLLVPLALLAAACLGREEFDWRQLTLAGAILAIGLWQAAHVVRFTPLWPKELAQAELEQPLRLLVANLDYENDEKEAVLAVLEEQQADLLLLVEIDDAWRAGLEGLRESYPHRLEEIRGDGLGLALWSRLELKEAEVRHLVSEDRASVLATVQLPDGGEARLVGLHPVPPGIESKARHERRDSRERDAELVLVAKEVRDEPHTRWIVAGDFNDVAWSHTTRLFKRLSDLRDPRVGRMLLATYHAQHPLLRYPIDQLFLPEGSRIGELARVKLPGSDHFGFLAEFAVAADPEQDAAKESDHAEAAKMVAEGAEDAEKNDGG